MAKSDASLNASSVAAAFDERRPAPSRAARRRTSRVELLTAAVRDDDRVEARRRALPARESFSVIMRERHAFSSNTQRVQPSSIGSFVLVRKIAMRRARVPLKRRGERGFGHGGDERSGARGRRPATAATSTPNSSGSVCAVTSYGRFGGPPGYSCRSGYCCRSSSALAYAPNGCCMRHDVAAGGIASRRRRSPARSPRGSRPGRAAASRRAARSACVSRLRLRNDDTPTATLASPRRQRAERAVAHLRVALEPPRRGRAPLRRAAPSCAAVW